MEDDETKEFAFHTMALFQFMQDFVYALKEEPNLTVKKLYFRFSERRLKGYKNFALLNQDTLILFAFGLIALPKETFFDKIPSIDFLSLPENWGTWDVKIWADSRDIKSFVRHLRNSINHGLFSSDKNIRFTFEDRLNENSPINFRVQTDHDSIFKFSKSFGDGYIMNKWPK